MTWVRLLDNSRTHATYWVEATANAAETRKLVASLQPKSVRSDLVIKCKQNDAEALIAQFKATGCTVLQNKWVVSSRTALSQFADGLDKTNYEIVAEALAK